MTEEKDGVLEAEIILKAHSLGEFINNPENKERIKKRYDDLYDKINKDESFGWGTDDIVTQATIMRYVHAVCKDNPRLDMEDLKFIYMAGYLVAQEKEEDNGD